MLFNFIIIALAAIATFIFFGPLPVFIKLLWIALFVLFWLVRKFIQENIISWLQSHTVNNYKEPGQPSNFWDKIESFIWITDSGEKSSSDQWKYKRSPNVESLKVIRGLISMLILIVFIGIPGILFGAISIIGAILNACWSFLAMLAEDLSFANGIGFFFGAILEGLITLIALTLVVLCLVKRITLRDFSSHVSTVIFKKCVSCKAILIATMISVLLQRITSWLYFEYSFMDALGEIVWCIIIVLAVFGIAFLRKMLHARRNITSGSSDDTDDSHPF